eukprot:964526-Amphidinium_carterae.3
MSSNCAAIGGGVYVAGCSKPVEAVLCLGLVLIVPLVVLLIVQGCARPFSQPNAIHLLLIAPDRQLVDCDVLDVHKHDLTKIADCTIVLDAPSSLAIGQASQSALNELVQTMFVKRSTAPSP